MNYDYSYFARTRRNPSELDDLQFDILISAYNRSERVRSVWRDVNAEKRIWINHSQYGFERSEFTDGDAVVDCDSADGELATWLRLVNSGELAALPRDAAIGVDITGMMRPYVATMPLAFAVAGFKTITAIYSDPSAYVSGVGTEFSKGPVLSVAPMNGFEGQHNASFVQKDLVIIGAGYDDQLIAAVAEAKRAAEHVVLVGLPSLQPHMYQESILKLHKASESINSYSRREHLFSPANDPFVTAGVISDYLASRGDKGDLNVYLSPTGPKTQVLGFAWYYLCEAVGGPISLIFPYSAGYSQETSTGISRTQTFELELGCIDLSGFGI